MPSWEGRGHSGGIHGFHCVDIPTCLVGHVCNRHLGGTLRRPTQKHVLTFVLASSDGPTVHLRCVVTNACHTGRVCQECGCFICVFFLQLPFKDPLYTPKLALCLTFVADRTRSTPHPTPHPLPQRNI